MSETNLDGSSVSSEDGKQNEPLQTISTNIPEVTVIVDFPKQIDTINTRLDIVECDINDIKSSVNDIKDDMKNMSTNLGEMNSSIKRMLQMMSDNKNYSDTKFNDLDKKMEELEDNEVQEL